MKNIILQISKLTCMEKELLVYYSVVGISVHSKNEYIANTEKSMPLLNQLTARLIKKGFLKRDNGLLTLNKL